jgi:hypothetical protein
MAEDNRDNARNESAAGEEEEEEEEEPVEGGICATGAPRGCKVRFFMDCSVRRVII